MTEDSVADKSFNEATAEIRRRLIQDLEFMKSMPVVPNSAQGFAVAVRAFVEECLPLLLLRKEEGTLTDFTVHLHPPRVGLQEFVTVDLVSPVLGDPNGLTHTVALSLNLDEPIPEPGKTPTS